MKKIPTLFIKEYNPDHSFVLTENVKPGLGWVLDGEGLATVKWDGSCCAVFGGVLYKRYDAKKGKKAPEGAIPCEAAPDPVTGHWPHWVKCEEGNPADKWFLAAYKNTLAEAPKEGAFSNAQSGLMDWTYEAVGPHFQGNPYGLSEDKLIQHGMKLIDLPDRSFDAIREYLEKTNIEGIVFWKDGEAQCKIKRRDFGFRWPNKDSKQ